MSRVFFSQPLESTATFCRIERRDGVTIGLTSHDRDLWFDGVLHRSGPGMVPSAIQRSATLSLDSADVRGALTHDAISARDLAEGRFDRTLVAFGVVDWETLERAVLYRGEIGEVATQDASFEAELRSAKSILDAEFVPRTSPACRAQFCGPGCGLSAARFTHDLVLAAVDPEANRLSFAGAPPAERLQGGHLRWIDGPHAGLRMEVIAADEGGLTVEGKLHTSLVPGVRAEVREGCDHTFATCAARFANSVNFRGEPFLPGNDFVTRGVVA